MVQPYNFAFSFQDCKTCTNIVPLFIIYILYYRNELIYNGNTFRVTMYCFPFYALQCFQNGNFVLKQIITYTLPDE